MYKSSSKPLNENQFYPNKILKNYFGAAWMKIYVEKLCEFYSNFQVNKYTVIRHSNIYGPNDKFDFKKSHVFGASISKVLRSDSKPIEVWGDGKEKRNFLYVDDLMNFINIAIKKQKTFYELCNLGSDKSISIKDLIKKIIYVTGKKKIIKFNLSKPTLKIDISIDSSKAKKIFGWRQKTNLETGIKKTIKWCENNSIN